MASIPYPERVAMAIRDLREAAGISQGGMAKALSISQPAYSRIESGISKLSIKHLGKYASHIGILPSVILAEAEKPLSDSQHNAIMLDRAKKGL